MLLCVLLALADTGWAIQVKNKQTDDLNLIQKQMQEAINQKKAKKQIKDKFNNSSQALVQNPTQTEITTSGTHDMTVIKVVKKKKVQPNNQTVSQLPANETEETCGSNSAETDELKHQMERDMEAFINKTHHTHEAQQSTQSEENKKVKSLIAHVVEQLEKDVPCDIKAHAKDLENALNHHEYMHEQHLKNKEKRGKKQTNKSVEEDTSHIVHRVDINKETEEETWHHGPHKTTKPGPAKDDSQNFEQSKHISVEYKPIAENDKSDQSMQEIQNSMQKNLQSLKSLEHKPQKASYYKPTVESTASFEVTPRHTQKEQEWEEEPAQIESPSTPMVAVTPDPSVSNLDSIIS